ncbi:fumarylacetoacetate hydrolase [Fusarium flagelliforme]|uniref:Fumarylacetoacetate hydrolase n=1 Tax=Fusarium flagelliforme TaxID=2675880 RepID=A0A395N3U8_9HYPO|nr:fumarylacetoacetate hydrolase [Fusarium flagelliforme]
MSTTQFKRLVRFVPRSNTSSILIGQPVSEDVDVGLALFNGDEVAIEVFSGTSVLNPGENTGAKEIIERVLSPLAANEVGTVRCIGLNYKQHADEVGITDLPTIPTVFMKPSTAIGDPWPALTLLPKITQLDDCGDYESELAVVIGKTAKNVSEVDALNYVLGYTACNDVSSRTNQFAQSQWSYSKGFDGSCPLGPTIVSTTAVPDPSKFRVRGLKNDELLQDCGVDDLIFTIPKVVSFLSQSTTLLPGTVIITGTPAGVGMAKSPKVTLHQGDQFKVEIKPYIGTLINVFQNE